MSGDQGATDRPQLEGLVLRARHDLRDWTDRPDHDPGVALLELFALVAELLTSHSQRLGAEAYLGDRHAAAFSSALLQQGRVVIDAEVGEEPTRAPGGVYQATVLDDADPLLQRRLLVRVLEVSGDESVWAAACLPVPGTGVVPAIGDGVWVAFESSDPTRPVWLGQRITG